MKAAVVLAPTRAAEMDDPRVAQSIEAETVDTYTVVVARAEEATGVRPPGYAEQVERAVLITAAMG